MSLKVYFGTTLINEDYYTGLTNNFELFNESFKLGATPSNTYKLTIAKEGVSSQPTSVTLKDGNDTFAELKVDNIEEKDGMYYEYTLTDKILDLDFYYDASEIFVNGSTTLLAIAQDICTKAGLTLGTTNFRGYNKEISWYDNRRTAREYIGYIAELNGGFARIENDVLYFRKQKTNSASTIEIDECENLTIGEYHKITRVIYELGALKYEFGDETGNTLYLNNSNVFITEESEVQAIYNDIKNFEFYSFETSNCPIDSNVLAGDVITFTDGTNNYPTIAQYDLEYYGGWIGGYNLNINTERQEETQIVGTKEQVKNIQIRVDRDENTITELVETTETIEGELDNITDTTNTAEGKYIYLNDSSDQPIIDIRLNGETNQDGEMPSPEFPSEIINIEGKNKFNKDAPVTKISSSSSLEVLTTGIRMTALDTGTNKYASIIIPNSEKLLGKKVTLSATITPSTSNRNSMGRVLLYGLNSSDVATGLALITLSTTGDQTATITMPDEFPSGTAKYALLFYSNHSATVTAGDYVDYTNVQLEVSAEKTNYAPYNNIQIYKYNKNLLDFTNYTKTGNGNVVTVSNGLSIKNNTSFSSGAINIGYNMGDIKKYLGKTLTFSTKVKNYATSDAGEFTIRFKYGTSSTEAQQTLISQRSWEHITSRLDTAWSHTATIPDNITGNLYIWLLRYPATGTWDINFSNLQLEEDDTATDFTEYSEITYNFPLSNGQKLYEGSFLTDDGVHNTRKQVVFDASEDENWTSVGAVNSVYRYSINLGDNKIGFKNSICSHFPQTDKTNFSNINEVCQSTHPSDHTLNIFTTQSTLSSFKTWLSNNPITVEYELEDAERISYTNEQNEAWNEITNMNTYIPITHIYSDAYAHITYMRNNDLTVYETRANAKRQYTNTTNKFAQQQTTNESIISKVSEQETIIDNISGEVISNTTRLNTLEETVGGLTNTVYEKGGNNLFYYSKEFWRGQDEQVTRIRPIQVGDDLSGKTLYLSFPNGFSFGDTLEANIIVGANNYKIKSRQSSDISNRRQQIVASENNTDTTLYDYKASTSSTETNLTSFTLSNNFGIVTSINDNSSAYQYIQIQETVTENILNIQEVNGGEFGTNSESGLGYIVGNGSSYQEITEIPNGAYTISFMYKKVGGALTNGSVQINGISYNLEETEWTKFTKTINVTTNSIKLEFIANTDNTLYIADLLANIGTQANSWTQNANEVRTDTVKIGKGIEVSSSTKDTKLKADADGVRIVQASDERNVVAVFTKDGTETKQLKVNEASNLSGLYIQQVGNQIWLSSIL